MKFLKSTVSLIFFTIMMGSSQASYLDSTFIHEYVDIEAISFEQLLIQNKNHYQERSSKTPAFNVLDDPESKVDDSFKIPKYFRKAVEFWFLIYTTYSSNQVLIHDKGNMGIRYDVLDFQFLKDSSLGIYAKANMQTRYTRDYVKNLKKELVRLSKLKSIDKNNHIIKTIMASGLKIPRSKKQRIRLFRKLSRNIRAQTGQRNMLFRGIMNEITVDPTIQRIAKASKLPLNLLALPFLESSFNPYAYSKVGAAGAWQFMKRTGRSFMIVNKKNDHRSNPLISTVAGLQLLKQNKRITKRWDLAVSAYNNGTKHIRRAQKKLRRRFRRKMTLADMFKYYHSKHIGFASKNFFPSFLALVHILAYRDRFFPIDHHLEEQKDVKIYISKCSITPSKYINFKNLLEKYFNLHIRKNKSVYKKGTILISNKPLPESTFKVLSWEKAAKIYPKKWSKIVRKEKCK